MSQNFSEQQLSLCGDPLCNSSSCGTCKAIRASLDEEARIQCPNGVPSCKDGRLCDQCFNHKYPKEAFGGGKRPDVIPEQDFQLCSSRIICADCQKLKGLNPACDLCATLKKMQNDSQPPFTKEQVKKLHAEMKSGFCPPQTGRIFDLVVLLFSLTIGSIDWTMHNCAFSALVLMLSSSNAGLNSINQQTFAGYILAFIIKRLQETGKCDPILLEVLRLELSILSENPDWSNWSELVEFQGLYNVCVKYKIIFDDEVKFVLPNEDGSYNIGQTLDGKCRSTLVEAHKWSPCIYVLANGILSPIFGRFRISAVIIHWHDHFSIILFSQGIWLIDGKGTRTGEFKAESSIQELSIEQFQELCALHGAFYFFEEVPFVYETLNLSGIQGLPPRKVFYGKGWYFLYDDGTMICETTGITVNLQRSVFVNDKFGNYFRVFPALPPPPPCEQGVWVPPPPPPPPCAQIGWVPPPPPPSVEVARFFPPPPAAPVQQVAPVSQRPAAPVQQVAPVYQKPADISKKDPPPQLGQIRENHILVSGKNWSCEGRKYGGIVEKSPHPQFPSKMMEVYLFKTQRYTEIKQLVDFLNFYEVVNGSE